MLLASFLAIAYMLYTLSLMVQSSTSHKIGTTLINKITSLLEEKIGQWNLSSKLIEAPVQAAKRLNVRFIFLYGYYFSKASFFKIVYHPVGSFKSRDIRFLLSIDIHNKS